MFFTTSRTISGYTDVIVRFLNAGAPVSFGTPELQKTYQAILGGDHMNLSHKQIISLRLPLASGFSTVLLVGFDNSCQTPWDDFRALVASLGTALIQHKARTVTIDRLEQITFASEIELHGQLASVLPLCEYTYDKYLTAKVTKPNISVTLLTDLGIEALEEGLVLAQSVLTARDLVNEIAEVLTPEEMARRCEELGRTCGFDVEVLGYDDCSRLGMELFLSVARGSALEPKFIIMRYNGGQPDQAPIALVGKGVTYDSGGLAIKAGKGMASMRFDMNGGAAVIGAMCAIARQKLPHNVIAVVAACENMVDANSFRNGDVLRSMHGQTVYVQNTDAEGRLTMADAMTYCIRYAHPSEIIEVAGLTGSVCSFYGSVCAAALTVCQGMFDRVESLSAITGEKYAQMPTFPEYRQMLKSPYADLNNAPPDGPGGILAGLFLDSFSEGVPFLHIDFGAMPFTSNKRDGQGAGGTGFGVKTLYYYIKNR